MRIDKIEISDLASVKGTAVIDFTSEPLRSAGLFAVFADAANRDLLPGILCLALYGHAPQWPHPECLLKEGRGHCNVTFSLTDGCTYEASWSIRKKHAAESHPEIEHRLRKIFPKAEEVTSSDVPAHVKGLLHMDEARFMQSVWPLHDGFSRFLVASAAEKPRLLDQLVSVDAYVGIARAIHGEADGARACYQEMIYRLQGIRLSTLNEEELRCLQEKITHHRTRIGLDRSRLIALEEQQRWYEEYNDTLKQLDENRQLQHEAQRACNSLYDQEQLLERYDSVLPFQSLYLSICQDLQDIAALKEQIVVCQKEFSERQPQVQAIRRDYMAALSKQSEAQKNYHHELPKLNCSFQLEGEVAMLSDTSRKLSDQLSLCLEAIRSQEEDRRSKELMREEVENRLEHLRQYRLSVSMHMSMIEQIEMIKTLLRRISDLGKASERLQRTLKDDEIQLSNANKQQLKLEEERDRLFSVLSSLKEELKVHDWANHGLDNSMLQQRLSRLTDLRRRSRSALNLWKRIAAGYTDSEEKDNDLRRRTNSLNQIRKELETLQEKLATLIEARNVLRTSYMLSQGDNILALRRRLKEGSACPLCGATHHPYHSETELELGQLIAELEQNYQHAEEDVTAMREQIQLKQQQLAEENGQFQVEKDYFAQIQDRLQHDLQEWSDYEDMDPSFSDCSAGVNRQGRTALLQQLLDTTEREIQQQAEVNAQFNQHQEAINDVNRRIRQNTEVQQENLRYLSDIFTERSVLEARIQAKQEQLSQYSTDRIYLLNEADRLITLPQWKERWNNSHDNFLQEIITLADNWCRNRDQIQQGLQDEFRLQEEINALFNGLADKKRRRADLEQEIQNVQQTITAHQRQINIHCNGASPDQVQRQLVEELNEASKRVKESREAYDEALHGLQALQSSVENLRLMQQQRESDLLKHRSELDIRISRFNTDHSTLQYFELEKLFNDPRDWKNLRLTLAESHQRLDRINRNVESISQHILRLQQSPGRPSEDQNETPQAIEFQVESLRSRLQEMENELFRFETTLNRHRAAEEQLQHLEEERARLESEAADWSRLDELMGDDGVRYRDLARQQLFRLLVSRANICLASIAPRYRLQVADDSLALKLVDLEMLSQVRDFRSADKTEIFAAGLSLSLALSALHDHEVAVGSFFVNTGTLSSDDDQFSEKYSMLNRLQSIRKCPVGVFITSESLSKYFPASIHIFTPSGGSTTIKLV